MFCPQCGKQIADGVKFCPQCGAQINAPEPVRQPQQSTGYQEMPNTQPADDGLNDYYGGAAAPQPKKGKPKFVLPVVIAAVVVVAAVLIWKFVIPSSSAADLDTVARNTYEAIADRSDYGTLLYDYYDGGSISADIEIDDLGDFLDSIGEGFGLVNGSVAIHSAADGTGNTYAAVDATVMGVDIDAGLFTYPGGEGEIAISAPAVFDDAYGITLEDAQSELLGSIFSPTSDSKYSLSAYEYGEIMQALGVLAGSGDITTKGEEQALHDALDEEDVLPEYEKSSETIDAGDGKDVKATKFAAELTGDQLLDLLDAAADWLSEQMPAYESTVDQYVTRLESSGEIEDLTLSYSYYVYKGYLVKIEGTLAKEGEDEEVEFEALFGSDPTSAEEMSFALTAGDEEYELVLDLSEENAIGLTVSQPYDEDTQIRFAYDAAANAFALSIDDGYDDISVEGTMEIDDKTIHLSDFTVLEDGDEIAFLSGITMAVSGSADIPASAEMFPDGYTDILTITESEMDRLVEEIASAFTLGIYY